MNNEDLNQEQFFDETPEVPRCQVCGSSVVEQNYETALCKDCREKLYKRQFPIVIKVLGIIIIAVVIVAMIRFPSNLKAGVAYERGLKAERAGKYATATKEYKIVTKRFPDSTLALGRLFIATYHNGEINEASDLFDKIAGREPVNDKFVDEVNGTIDRLESIYYISDELDKIIEEVKDAYVDEAVELYQKYLETNPEDYITASYYYAYLLYDISEFDEAKTVMQGIMDDNPDFYDGKLLLADIYNELGEYDKASECCNTVIQYNSEYSYAYDTLSRIELKNHKDKNGLVMAKKAYNLNKEDSSIVATLAIAYHYNNMLSERDDMLKRFKEIKDNNTYDLDLMEGIFSGTNKWRE